MQVSVESTGTLKREMKVSVPEERIAGEVQNRLKSMSKKTKIDGFRQGKVPFKVIESRYGKQIRQEVLGEVIQSTYFEALQQEKLTPAGQPKIAPIDTDSANGLSYTATFEVMPDVKLAAVDKLEIEKPSCNIAEDDYLKMVEVLRKQRQTLEPADREAQTGDTVEIDFEGMMGGEVFEGGSAKDFKLELGQDRFIEGFETGLVGKKAGDEVTLDLKFPDDYHNKDLAAKPVTFNVTIKAVLEPVLPEMDDEFFKNFGVTDGGEEAFKKEVMAHMEKEAEGAIRNRLRDEVMDKLHKANPLDLPHSLVHEEVHRLEHQFKERLKSYGMNPDTQGEIPVDHAMFEEQAEKRVSLQLLVMELIKTEELKADPAKVRELIERNAASYEDPEMVINWYYQDKQRLSEIEGVILEDEVIDFICKKATVKDAAVKFDDLMNKGQTD